jgi:hypothetical protein
LFQGVLVGSGEGTFEGCSEGSLEGSRNVGASEGLLHGWEEGELVGCSEGALDSRSKGSSVRAGGRNDRAINGRPVGSTEGVDEGPVDVDCLRSVFITLKNGFFPWPGAFSKAKNHSLRSAKSSNIPSIYL